MKAWDKIRDKFNRAMGHEVYVSLDQLAEIVEPVHPPAKYDSSPESVAKGLSELTEWVRIGWDREKHKGTAFDAFYVVTRQMHTVIARAQEENGKPPAGVYMPGEFLRVVRAVYPGIIEEARLGLESIAKYQKKMPQPRISIDENGYISPAPPRPEDYAGVIQIYNRPGADHAQEALKLDECRKRLDRFFVQNTVRPANDQKLEQAAARFALFR